MLYGVLLQKCLDQGPDMWHASKISRGDLQTTFLFKGFEEVCHPACLVVPSHRMSRHLWPSFTASSRFGTDATWRITF